MPVQTILPVIELLKSGELSPAFVNRKEIANVEQELAELAKTMNIEELQDRKNNLRLKVEVGQARRGEIEKAIAELQARLDKLNDFEEEEAELKQLNRELFSSKRKLQKLKEKRDNLKNGFDG